MTKQAKRWTENEASRARDFIELTGTDQSIGELIYRFRQADRRHDQQITRAMIHLARHGHHSASGYYSETVLSIADRRMRG